MAESHYSQVLCLYFLAFDHLKFKTLAWHMTTSSEFIFTAINQQCCLTENKYEMSLF